MTNATMFAAKAAKSTLSIVIDELRYDETYNENHKQQVHF